jgi:hypothetical protein
MNTITNQCFGSTTLQLRNRGRGLAKTVSLLAMVLSQLLTLRLHAQDCNTMVGGTISGQTWTPSGSPYCVTSDVFVAGLTIQPGVEIRFLGNYVFQVGGLLRVTGPAIFTSTNVAVGWKGILFRNSLPGSFLYNCRIEHAKLSGVRITNSTPAFTNCVIANNSSPDTGAGINADVSSGDIRLVNCEITNNAARSHGGGIAVQLDSGQIILDGCVLSSNSANETAAGSGYVGGGIYAALQANAKLILTRSFLSQNYCAGNCNGAFCNSLSRGGGIYVSGGNLTVLNTRIENNEVRATETVSGGGEVIQSWGGGIYVNSGTLFMRNAIVAFNSATGAGNGDSPSRLGGGVYLNSGTTADIANCTLIGNNPHAAHRIGSSTDIRNSILYFNNAESSQLAGSFTVSHSDVQNGYAGTGNIDFNPLLCPENYMILAESPCVDAGDPQSAYDDACFSTAQCQPGSLGSVRNDMGAYGGPGACCWFEPCSAPIIRKQPQNQTTCLAREATFCVSATGSQPISYQWRIHGTNCAGAGTIIANATNACFTVSNAQSENAGYYSVVVANSLDSISSTCAYLGITPVCVSIDLYAGLTIGGTIGQTYSVQCVTNLASTNWTTLTTITQSMTEVLWIDTSHPANRASKFYRVIP